MIPAHIDTLLRAWAKDADARAAGPVLATRPRLREDVICFPMVNGALVRSDSHIIELPGEVTFELLNALAPRLNGADTVLAIAGELHSAEADALAAFIHQLVELGIVDDVAAAGRGPASDAASHARADESAAATRRLFAPEIELLHRLVDRPLEQFDRFRHADVFVTGQGASFAACCAALMRGGLATLHACPLGADADLDAARIEAVKLCEAGAPASVRSVESIDRIAPARPLAIYCSDAPVPSEIAALNRVCAARRHELLAGCVLDDVGLCGPLVESVSGGCWLCAVIRIVRDLPRRAQRAVYSLQDRIVASTATTHAGLARTIGRELAFEAFKILVGSRRLQTLERVIVHTADPPAPFTRSVIPTTLGACLTFCTKVVA